MKYAMNSLSIVFFIFFSGSIFAADIPQDDIGAQQFDQMQCVSENTQVCIDDTCLTSEETDCQDNCQKISQEKCQQQSDE